MAAYNGIQFKGVDRAVEAYESNAVPAWALCCGRDILFQYTGADMEEGASLLQAWLQRLMEADSNVQYQLRIYFEPKGPVNANTPCNQSFKFVLKGNDDPGSVAGVYNSMDRRLKAIEKKLDGGEPEEQGGIMGWVNGMLKQPEVQQMIMQKAFAFFNGLGGRAAAGAAGMAGMPTPKGADEKYDSTAELYNRLSPDERQKLDQAMEILLSSDPLIGTHLAKLAAILRDNPAKYKMYASML